MPESEWKKIWEKKGTASAGKATYSVDELFAADGFDGALGKTSAAAKKHIGELVSAELRIQPGNRILEVGCGAGAVLALLSEAGAKLSGADYSAPHIAIARRTLVHVEFEVAEAGNLPYADATFDGVFSNGVFLYFPVLDYAKRALEEIFRVAQSEARILILDNPDAALREECIAAREASGASLSPPHLYYPREFFSEMADRHGYRATFRPQLMPDYGNAPFRYNVLLEPVGK